MGEQQKMDERKKERKKKKKVCVQWPASLAKATTCGAEELADNNHHRNFSGHCGSVPNTACINFTYMKFYCLCDSVAGSQLSTPS